jgi:hypothetical protein
MKRLTVFSATLKGLFVSAVLMSVPAFAALPIDQGFAASSFFDIFYEVPGTIGTPFQVNAAGTALVRSQPPDALGAFDTEMLQLDLRESPTRWSIRESPSKASLGRATPMPQGIHSFFDVFTELSSPNSNSFFDIFTELHFEGNSSSFFDITYHLVGVADLLNANGQKVGEVRGGTIQMNSVPEPSTVFALVGGLGSILAFRRRRA